MIFLLTHLLQVLKNHAERQQRFRFLSLVLFCFVFPSSWADSLLPDSLSIHGFSTLGTAWLNEPGVVLERDLGNQLGISQKGNPLDADSRLGIQADWQINARWSTTIQAVEAPRVVQNANNAIPWAFVKYQINNDTYLRAGRMGVYAFALSDQRNVGYVYPWVRPPEEFYGFMPIYSMTGVDSGWHHDFNFERSIDVRAFVARSDSSYFLPDSVTGTDSFTLKLSPLLGSTIVMNQGNLTARLAYMTMKVGSTFPGLESVLQQSQQVVPVYPSLAGLPGQADILNSRVSFYDSSMNYDNGHIMFMAEAAYTDFQSHFKPSMETGYLTIGYHVSPKVLPYLTYARVRPARSTFFVNSSAPPAGLAYLPAPLRTQATAAYAEGSYLKNAFNSYYFGVLQENQQTLSLGVRWDFYPRMDLKAQVDRTRVFDGGYQLWQIPANSFVDPSGVTVWSLAWDTVF